MNSDNCLSQQEPLQSSSEVSEIEEQRQAFGAGIQAPSQHPQSFLQCLDSSTSSTSGQFPTNWHPGKQQAQVTSPCRPPGRPRLSSWLPDRTRPTGNHCTAFGAWTSTFHLFAFQIIKSDKEIKRQKAVRLMKSSQNTFAITWYFWVLGSNQNNIPVLSNKVNMKDLITKEEFNQNYRYLKSHTYSSIAPRRKRYLNVCFHNSFFHRWYCIIIGTKKISKGKNWYLFITVFIFFPCDCYTLNSFKYIWLT